MTDNDYTKLDSLILEVVNKYPGGNFQNVYAGKVATEVGKLEPGKGDRLAYIRMKELEKQGLIYELKKQWYPT